MLASIGSYEIVNDSSADDYRDYNAERSLSQTFISRDNETIKLFVGYRGEQTKGNRLRSPKMYFPDRWDFAWVKPAALPLDGATSIHGNWMLARKGLARELILYWYQIGARSYGGELDHRIEQIRRLFLERRSDGAIVRISTSLRNDEPIEVAQKRLQEFGIRLYPRLLLVLP
jgi:EpsI family protein